MLVGAIPGALPCLIGWVAAYGDDNISWTGGWILFGIQFLWQFPHFWAIAWIAHEDYTKAGFKLLPSDKGPTKFTACANSDLQRDDDSRGRIAVCVSYQRSK